MDATTEGDGERAGERTDARVLVVGDRPVGTGLSDRDGIRVRRARTGAEALDRLRAEDVDCVVAAAGLPDEDGVELLRAVRRERADLPFVLYAAEIDGEVASEAVSAGATDYLTADRDGESALVERVDEAVTEYRSQQRAASYERLARLVEQSPLGVVEWTPDLAVRAMNGTAEEILGYAESELRGESWESLVTAAERADIREQVDRLGREGGFGHTCETVRADGEVIRCEWHTQTVTDEDGDVVTVFSQFRDVTEREHRRERRQRQQEALVDLATDEAVTSGAFETGLGRITETVTEVLDLDRASVWLFGDDGNRLRCIDSYQRSTDAHDRGPELVAEEAPAYFEALTGSRSLATDDAVADPRTDGLEPYLEENDVGALLDATVRSEGEVVGVVCHEHVGGPREWTDDEVAFAGDVADLVARAYHDRDRVGHERDPEFQRSLLETQQEAVLNGLLVVDGYGEIVSYNDRFVDMWGIPEELLAEDDEAAALECATERVANPEAFLEGVEALHGNLTRTSRDEVELADGRVFDRYTTPLTGPDGTQHGRLWSFRDITARTERERDLRRYETMVNTAGDMVYILDTEGRFQFVNDTAEELTGYSRQTLLGAHTGLIMDEEADVAAGRELIQNLLREASEERTGRTSRTSDAFSWTLRTADGETSPCESHITLLFDGEEWVGTVGVVRDVSERLERERELKRQNERLEEFASVVSHDLRNPLNVARGRLELASEGGNDPHVEAAADALDRMGRLIDDLLALAHEGTRAHDPEEVDLAGRARRSWGHVATGDATLTLRTDRTVVADDSRFGQLFENLFRNAVEHGSTSPWSHAPEDAVEHGSPTSDSQARRDDVGHGDPGVTVEVGDTADGFYVTDDGPGIPAGERDRVFEGGYSTGESGTGFGLAIVEEIAEAHGWEVRVTESESGGARFEVTGVEAV